MFSTDVQRFFEDVQRQAEEFANKYVGEAVHKLAATAVEKLVMGSPVGDPSLWKVSINGVPAWLADYEGGRFRANWNVSFGSPSTQTTDERDKGGFATITRNVAALSSLYSNPYQKIFISNALPYAWPLEHGHSTQAPGPAAIVGKTYAELSVEYSSYLR